ncbi:MAG: hypothetical protein WCX71_03885 [Candidatus Buchananbacteria bacterium]
MTEEKWQETIGTIKDSFGITSQRLEDLAEEEGGGTVEIVEFEGPLGLMKLEFISQPLVLGKKTIGSKRIGSQATVEYIHSDTEKIHRLKVYKFDPANDVWVEMEKDKGERFFQF